MGEARGRGRGSGGVGRGRGEGWRGEPRVFYPVGAKLLEEKCRSLEPRDLLFWLTGDRGVKALLESNSPNDQSQKMMISAVRKACATGRSENLTQLLIWLRDSPLFKGLSVYLSSVGLSKHKLEELTEDLVELLSHYMTSLPSDSAGTVSLLALVIESRIVPALNLQRLKPQLERIKVMTEEAMKKQTEETEGTGGFEEKEEGEPPDDFHQIDIFPTVEDLNNCRPFLRRNIVNGNFKNLDTYLDIQFRLLREDFVRPLREGIKEFKDTSEKGLKVSSKDIKIYHDVRVLFPDLTPQGVTHQIRFSLEGLRGIRWENSKRLIFGSLVCFSSDNFKSLLFATIANREPKSLRDGRIDVFFHNASPGLMNQTYTMVESSTYFEAYRHVLQSLQEVQGELPFQRYIVGELTKIPDPFSSRERKQTKNTLVPSAPRYLQFETTYDIRPLMKKEFVNYGKKVRVRVDAAWPAADMLGLDDSQQGAVVACLTRQLAIVQGPPGTGKTFIGLKVAEVLLLNSEVWSHGFLRGAGVVDLGERAPPQQSPILVLCYTNHALDQFLEGISSFQDTDIVRVGSRSKNPAMEKFNLNNLRSQMRSNKSLPRDIHANFGRIKSEMAHLHEQIQVISVMMEAADKHILSERELGSILSDNVIQVLEAGFWEAEGSFELRGRQPKSFLGEWLGVGNRVADLSERFECSQPFQCEQPTLPEEEDGVDVDEDAKFEEARRVGDDDQEVLDYLKKSRRERAERMNQLDLAYEIHIDEEEVKDRTNNSGWQISKAERKRRKNLAKAELTKITRMTEKERQLKEQLLWRLTSSERWKLYRTWVHQYKNQRQDNVKYMMSEYDRHTRRLAEVREQESLYLMRRAKVVGMTTTGAAKVHSMLHQLKPSIIIVEEAAEVLEAHIVASLTPSCQHLILIGDHQQLRPSPTVFELAKTYNLDVSLFERLIKNGLAFSRLEIQHRMRPEISKLLVPHIYKELEDHESVLEYPSIAGVQANMYFIDHNKAEDEVTEGHSKANDHEASFLVEMCRYLIKQGYKAQQITILTTYSGQLFAFKNKMPREEFEGVRVSTVDNYQGEENDILLLSLVRSNSQGTIGFLGIDNRVCVALSRARHALYCIGNFAQLCAKSQLWNRILTYVKNAGLLGDGIVLQCQQHPQYSQKVSDAKTIRAAFPEGGCTKPCSARLECGHVCQLSCHSWDPRHTEYKCRKQCGRLRPECPDDHPCKKFCSSDCGPCPEPKEAVLPRCGHVQATRCGDDLSKVLCQEKCTKIRGCGHACLLLCGVDCSNPANRCMAPVMLSLSCGHSGRVHCYASDALPQCVEKCTKMLDCGHVCTGSCRGCQGDRLHKPCKQQECSKPLVCGHTCKELCSLPCLCRKQCETACAHSKCPKRCGEPCDPCMEPCVRSCQHGACVALCSEPCTREPCLEPCPASLPCGHPCIGLCGDPCPKKCATCHEEEVTQVVFGPEDEDGARFVQLVDCCHTVHAESLDKWVNDDVVKGAVRLPVCPFCKTPIRKTLRYNSVLNSHLKKVEAVKEKLRGEESKTHKIKITETIKQELKVHLTKKTREDEPEYSEKDVKWLSDLVKSVISAESALGLHQLRKCQQMLDSLYTLHSLARLTRPKKKANTGAIGALKMFLDLGKNLDSLKKIVVATLLSAGKVAVTDQQVKEILQEVARLQNLSNLIAWVREKEDKQIQLNPDSIKVLVQMEKVLTNIWSPFNSTQEEMWKKLSKELNQTLSGLGISDVEKKEVVAAMGLSSGHWYSCPNGHVYAIGDCGGATVEGTCPECRARIGGTGHRLLSSNQAARHMDSSTREDYQWGLQDGQ